MKWWQYPIVVLTQRVSTTTWNRYYFRSFGDFMVWPTPPHEVIRRIETRP